MDKSAYLQEMREANKLTRECLAQYRALRILVSNAPIDERHKYSKELTDAHNAYQEQLKRYLQAQSLYFQSNSN